MKYIISVITIYFILGFFLFIFQRKIVFNVSGKPQKPSRYNLKNIKELNISTFDNIGLLAWYSSPALNKPTMLYFHGNSYDIGERSYRINKYIKEGWGVLLLSWRGYSGNKGSPSEKNLYIDAESSLKWLEENTKTQKNNLIVYGESLGTGVAVEMATRYDFKSIILEAPFTSLIDIAKERYKIFPTKYLVLDKFDNLQKIKQIKSPILIISGGRDEIIPHKHSIRLYNKANEPKDCLFIDEAMHNNLYDFGIEKKVINFTLNIWK